MTKAILGTKVGMTQVFTTDGKMHAATVLHVEPNVVLRVMTEEKDGYKALKVGYKTVAKKSLIKPELGQFKDTGTPKKFIKEFRNMTGYEKGQEITVELFEAGEYVNAQARTKGHGFTGSIKRHNFKIGPMGHGAGYPHRYVGSVSGGRGGSQAQRVFKGHPLPGHYGNELVTIQNLLVLEVNAEKNYIIVKGAIPGPKGAIITLRDSVKFAGVKETVDLVKNAVEKPAEVKTEKPAEKPVETKVEKPAEVKTEEIVEVKAEEPVVVENTKPVEEAIEVTVIDDVATTDIPLVEVGNSEPVVATEEEAKDKENK